MRFLVLPAIATLLSFSMESLMTAQATEPDFDEISGWIERQLEYTKDPSLSVAVVKDGTILFAEGFGWADKQRRKRADAHTAYSIASVSKPLTATAIQRLAEAGKLDVDQPANAYLGKAKITNPFGDADDITLRHLMNHTSGLGLHYQFYYQSDDHPVPYRDTTIQHYGIAVRPPGESYRYCNLGYGILDYIIARQSRLSYAEFMDKHVFGPLGMTHSFVGLPTDKQKNTAVRYNRQGQAIPHYEFDHDGGSAIYASAYDLARFAVLHIGNGLHEVLSPAFVEQMKEPTASVNSNAGYGMGWLIEDGDHYLVSHTGGMPGVATRVTLAPKEGLAVICLSNTESSLPHQAVKKILSECLEDYPYDHPNLLLRSRRQTPPPFKPTEELIGTWTGEIKTYEGERHLTLWVGKDGTCRARLEGHLVTLVTNAQFNDGLLTGIINGDLQTSDTSRVKHRLRLQLVLRKGQLVGAVEAVTDLTTQWIQGKKIIPKNYYGLSHFTSLKRSSKIGSQQVLFNGRDLDGWQIIKKYDFKNHGSITGKDGVLKLGKGSPASGVRVAGDFPKMNYQVELEARRVEGSDFFCGMTFPIHDAYCTLIIGGWGGGVVGLSNIDTMAAVENETTSYLEVENNRWYKVAVSVDEERVRVWIDNKEYANVKTKEHKFDIWWEQEPAMPFGLVSWNTGAEFRNIKIKPSQP